MPDRVKEKLSDLLYEASRGADTERYIFDQMADYLIANGVTVQEWIPVTERLPREDTRVLVWLVDGACKYTRMDTDRLHNNKWVRWRGYVTHWMSLPEPPKGD